MVKHLHFILFCFFLLFPHTSFASVNATLDQSITSWGESVLLTIAVDGDADGEPELSVLQQDFDILSQSQSSNYSVVNGSFSKTKQWRLSLMPKRMGVLEIPAITVGNQSTKALTLRVLAQQATPNQSQDIFLEMKASVDEVYVQAQVVLTIKLFRAVNLSQAELSEPEVPHAVLKKLGEDKTYETVVEQRRFVVTERKYAVFPEQEGKLEVPALVFNGRLASNRSVFGQGGKAIRLMSSAVHVNVLPKPDVWDKQKTWLPAQEVSLRELWTDGQSTTYKVGEPLTRTLVLSAKGLTAAQLPVLVNAQDIKGFKQYPDQPVLEDQGDSVGIQGVRQEKVALIPTQAGELTLPSIEVSWWNITEKRKQTALIPARVIDVLPAGQGQASAAMPQQPAPMNQVQEAMPSPTKTLTSQQKQQGFLWKWIALLSALGWIMTVGLWMYKSTQQMQVKPEEVKSVDDVPLKKVLASIRKACEQGDAEKVIQLLPIWGRLFFQDEGLQYLGQLKGKSAALDDALNDLERYLYGQEKDQAAWSGDALLQAIVNCESVLKGSDEKKTLKPLYPDS